ncbi:MAG: Dehydrogenase [Chitinophagaceae bacterium]|nr:Dehydrogenase [Chitinophagaceae bacterium]
MQRIAVLGLGRMGKGIALSILRSGRTVIAWNRSSEKAKAVLDAGAVWADSPAEAAMQADAVIAMLADDIASEEVWLGKNGAMSVMKPGAFVIECSTLSLSHVDKLAGVAKQMNLIYIDCPVTGMPDAAAQGQLTLLLGTSAEDFKTCSPLLQSFSRSIRHFGPVGTGTSYKLMINLMGAVQIAALAEGIAMAEKLGLNKEMVIASIETSAAASPQVVRYARKMAEKKFSENPAFTVELRHKDAMYATTLADKINSPATLGAVARDWFAAAKKNYKDQDEATVINLMVSEDFPRDAD